MIGLLAWRLIRRQVNSLNSISYERGRYDTAPFAFRSRPPNGAIFINQLLGAVIFLCMW